MDTAVTTSEFRETQADRRRAHRQAFVTKAMLYRDNRSAGPQRITVKDVSMLGLGFETASAVETGTRCRIVIDAGPTRIQWRFKVVCCGKIADDLYRIGCEFLPAERDLFDLSDEDLGLGDVEDVLVLQ